MLRPSFTIVHELRRPVDEPPTWTVQGRCAPPEFDALAEARLFIEREIAKYQNGSLIPYQPTHAILWQPAQAPVIRRRIPVRMIAVSERPTGVLSALYQEEEWRECVIPEWNYDSAIGRLLLEGILMGFSWALRPYEQSLDMETIW